MSSAERTRSAYSGEFARFHDALRQYTDYPAQVEALVGLIEANSLTARPRVLDVGCGTGIHAHGLAALGFPVTGIDISADMIAVAQQKNSLASFRTLELGSLDDDQYDFGLALGNVINCLDSIEEMREFFKNFQRKLRIDGRLFFECWNAVAAIVEPPTRLERSVVADGKTLTRVATPFLSAFDQQLRIEYAVWVADAGEVADLRAEPTFSSSHQLMLFTPAELREALADAGFRDVRFTRALPELGPAGSLDRMLGVYCSKA